MKYSLFLAAAATGALASLNCTTLAPIKTYCCPDKDSEVVKTIPEGGIIMLGCAADFTDKEYYWNYNGLYTPFSEEVEECNLNGMRFADMKVLPDCEEDTFVLDYTHGNGGTGPLDECNPTCVTDDDFPEDVYFGDTQKGINMATDFPYPEPTIIPGFGGAPAEGEEEDADEEEEAPAEEMDEEEEEDEEEDEEEEKEEEDEAEEEEEEDEEEEDEEVEEKEEEEKKDEKKKGGEEEEEKAPVEDVEDEVEDEVEETEEDAEEKVDDEVEVDPEVPDVPEEPVEEIENKKVKRRRFFS